MSTDQKDLPVAQWEDVSTFSVPAQVHTRTPYEEMMEWAPTFRALGWDVADAMRSHYEKHSTLLEKCLRTYDDVYAHILGAQEREYEPTDVAILHAPEQLLTTLPQDSAPEEDKKARKVSERARRIEAARVEWKRAIADKKAAMDQWTEYVRTLHDKFVSLRDEK